MSTYASILARTRAFSQSMEILLLVVSLDLAQINLYKTFFIGLDFLSSTLVVPRYNFLNLTVRKPF